MNVKICSGCKIEKDFKEFNKCKRGKLGLHNHCRVCQKICKRKYYLLNLDNEKEKGRAYGKSEKCKIERKIRYQKNKEKILEKNRIRRRTPRARMLANKARNKIYRTNIGFRMSVNLRARTRHALKGKTKVESTLKMLGCSPEELRVYLESKFTNGMSWSNYGRYGWHIDHIMPCDSFDLSKPEEQRKCFHYTNLQPLWWRDNMSKGNKVPVISSL